MNEKSASNEKSGMTGFREILTANTIPANQIQFWELWVKQYANYCGIESIRPDDKKMLIYFLYFLRKMIANPGIIEQAERAITLYLQVMTKQEAARKFG